MSGELLRLRTSEASLVNVSSQHKHTHPIKYRRNVTNALHSVSSSGVLLPRNIVNPPHAIMTKNAKDKVMKPRLIYAIRSRSAGLSNHKDVPNIRVLSNVSASEADNSSLSRLIQSAPPIARTLNGNVRKVQSKVRNAASTLSLATSK